MCFVMVTSQLSGMVPAFFGYDAPEVNESRSYSMQSDVYSFGIVMLELLTGRKSFDRYVWLFFTCLLIEILLL